MATDQKLTPASSDDDVLQDLRPKGPARIRIDHRVLLQATLSQLKQETYVEEIERLDSNFYICILTVGYPPYQHNIELSTKTLHGVSAVSGELAAVEAYDDALADLEDNRLIVVDDIRAKKRDNYLQMRHGPTYLKTSMLL